MESSKPIRWTSGQQFVGSYHQWIYREFDLTYMERAYLMAIADETLAHRKKYSFITAERLPVSESSRKRLNKALKEKGLLIYRRTENKTYYELVLSEEMNKRCVFLKKIKQAKQGPARTIADTGSAL